MGLVTLAQAKRQTNNEEFDADDVFLEEAITDATEILLNYLKMEPDAYQNTPGEPENVPGSIARACLLMVAELYKDREADTCDPLTQKVKDLVHRYRDPALA